MVKSITGRFALYFFVHAVFAGSFCFSQGYSVVERTDLRCYENGRYVGLTNREVRSFISPSSSPDEKFDRVNHLSGGAWFDGYFYVMEETNRNLRSARAGVHDSIDSTFYLDSKGKMTLFKDNGFPTFRSFPSFPASNTKSLSVGDAWTGTGERAVDPLNKGIVTRIPMNVSYEYLGKEDFKGENVYRLKAMWGTNYGISSHDVKGDSTLLKATGGHKADILVRVATNDVILIIDQIDETFFYSDGRTINFKGTLNHFTEYPPALDTGKMLPSLNRLVAKSSVIGGENGSLAAGASTGSVSGKSGSASGKGGIVASVSTSSASGKGGIAAGASTGSASGKGGFASGKGGIVSGTSTGSASGKGGIAAGASTGSTSGKSGSVAEKEFAYEETEAGLRLSIRNIKFLPDSAEILPEERSRLAEIAEVLKMASGAHFLVEGHTASVGKPQGEQLLSEQRAHSIAKEMEKLGVNGAAFICKGYGGNKPIADNGTDSGRALNRRVEITILK